MAIPGGMIGTVVRAYRWYTFEDAGTVAAGAMISRGKSSLRVEKRDARVSPSARASHRTTPLHVARHSTHVFGGACVTLETAQDASVYMVFESVM